MIKWIHTRPPARQKEVLASKAPELFLSLFIPLGSLTAEAASFNKDLSGKCRKSWCCKRKGPSIKIRILLLLWANHESNICWKKFPLRIEIAPFWPAVLKVLYSVLGRRGFLQEQWFCYCWCSRLDFLQLDAAVASAVASAVAAAAAVVASAA